MPKIQLVDPSVVRQPSVLKIKDIPVNQYKSDAKAEVKRFGKEKMVRIFQTMATIREFETMLSLIKTQLLLVFNQLTNFRLTPTPHVWA